MPGSLPVLYLNHATRISGAEESLLALMSRLDSHRFIPILACPAGDLADRAQQMGVKVEILPMPRFQRTANPVKISTYAFSWVFGSNQLRRIIRKLSPKLIHANSATAQVYAGALARKSGIPCAWQARYLNKLPFPAGILCRDADRMIAVSDAVVEFLAAEGLSRPRISRIYSGIDAAEWRARATGKNVKHDLALPSDARIILMASKLVPWARHEDAVRAMSSVVKEVPAARLLLAGAEPGGEMQPLQPELQKLAGELGILDKVIFAGYRTDMPDLIAASELVVIPSDVEPFGRVALEAMAFERPVVGVRAGGIPEVVRDGWTGLLCAPRMPESLAKACLRILQNANLAKSLGEEGRLRCESSFSIERTLQETQEMYDTMLHPPLKWIRS